MSRLVKIVGLGAIASLGALAAGLAATGHLPILKKANAPSVAVAVGQPSLAPAVSIDLVSTMDFVETLLVTGTLVPRDEILVGPEIEGLRIVEVLADEGETVKKGQILARLVSDTLEAQLAQNDAGQAKARAAIAQSRSNIVSAEARLVEAKNNYERGKPLRQSGYLSEALLDQRESAFKTARASLEASQDALKLSEADLAQVMAQRRELDWRRGRTDVRAPADGVISRRVARVGGFAAGAGDAMFRIIAKGEIELEAEIPETRLTRLKPGQSVDMDIPGAPGLKGSIRIVSPEVDKASRLGRVRVLIDTHPALRIGAFARGTVALEKSRGLSIHGGAVQYLETGPVVQVVAEGKVAVRPVTIGLASAGRVEIRSGLVEHEMVVAKSGTFLRNGDAVRPILPGRADAAPSHGGAKQ